MQKFKNIYVAASSQHVGKTTSTLGLVSGFMKKGLNVGYCKPVGQQYLDLNNVIVDKDTVLFAELIHFEIDPEIHSPVILGNGATTDFLENPDQFHFYEDLQRAKDKLSQSHELVIYEGTGHPGVGSIADISNAQVAKFLDAGVVIVVPGGIGSTVDMLNMTMSLFREQGVPIVGIIINKVIPEKLEKVKYYVGKWLEKEGLSLLGVIPYDPTLGYPIIRSISKAVEGTITYNANCDNNKVDEILAGSLIDLQELKGSSDKLLVVSTKALNNAINKIEKLSEVMKVEDSPLSGIVATGVGNIDRSTLKYIEQYNIPLIRTHLDTYGCVVKISQIEVKINQNTPWKVKKAVQLIHDNVRFESILHQV